jgi:hypothetical protein
MPALGECLFQLSGVQQLLAGFSLVGFVRSEKARGLAIPSNSVPKSFAFPANGLEQADCVPWC